MRVAYCINQYPKVSHSFIRREIHALERLGFEVLRISLRGWNLELVDAADQEERARTRYVLRQGVFPLLTAMLRMLAASPRRFLSALMLALRMARSAAGRPLPYHLAYFAEACRMLPWIRAFGAMHLHAHFAGNSAEVAMLVRALGGPPYSFTVHGHVELPTSAIHEKLRRAAFVVAISSYGRSQIYLYSHHADWHKVHVVHCGLDRAFYDVPEVPVPVSPRLVCVGRLAREKGQLLLVEAAYRLASNGVEFELVLAGDGEMRADVERRIQQLGLSRRVRITGWISSEQVRAEILAARGLVVPSFSEGLPVVIMEAMALRRPVLAPYVGGIPELVLAGENGWLFPSGSVDEMAVAMEQCLKAAPHDLEKFGGVGYRRAVERHSVDVEAAKLAGLFRISSCKAGQTTAVERYAGV